MTSRALLSVRSPRKAGCRISPSLVHSVNFTWRRQQQLIFESDNLLDAVCIDDFDACQYADATLNVDFMRPTDHVIQSLKGNLDEVVLRIIGDADERLP
jgi:hypothetical protein